MAKTVVIVDSEVKAQTLRANAALDIETILLLSTPMKVSFVASGDEEPEEGGLSFDFAPTEQAREFSVQLLASAASGIYLALDNDHMGDYWSWMIAGFLASKSEDFPPARRLMPAGLNPEDIATAFEEAQPVEDTGGWNFLIRTLFSSCLSRHLQRLIGTASGPGDLQLNSSSLTTLFLLGERKNEIELYSPTMKWQVRVNLSAEQGELFARLQHVRHLSDDGFIEDPDQVRAIVNSFKEYPFTVTSVNRSSIEIPAPSPYRLPDLLQDAFLFHGISPKQAFQAVTELFAGVVIDGKRLGLISSCLPMDNGVTLGMIEKIRQQVSESFGKDALGRGNDVDPDSGHIVPLKPEIPENAVRQASGETASRIYSLIRNRALASQMIPAAGETIGVDFSAGENCAFHASMRSVHEKGYLRACHSPQEKSLLDPCPLAGAVEGQIFSLLKILPEKISVFPAELYTLDSLFVDLADFSMIFDRTGVDLIQQLLDLKYIEIDQDGYLQCLDRLFKVTDIVNRVFPTMTGINLSAYIEQTVEEVVSGRKAPDFALNQFEQTFYQQGKSLGKAAQSQQQVSSQAAPQMPRRQQTSSRIFKASPSAPPQKLPSREIEPAEVKIPEESGQIVDSADLQTDELAAVIETEDARLAEGVGEGLDQKMETANASLEDDIQGGDEQADEVQVAGALDDLPAEMETGPEPDMPGQAISPATKESRKCPQCARPLLLKGDKYGKFWACSGFPACRHTEAFVGTQDEGMECPVCRQGTVILKRTPAGKDFYVCPEDKCEFMAWSKPHPVVCPACSLPYLVEKKNIRGKIELRCPRAGCNYKQSLSGAAVPDDAGDASAAPQKKTVRIRRVPGGGVKRRVVVRRKK
ncbi:MAG: topoisomerase DNA-binding C4 zinc finger domain-containing protein [Proteobacteria bacterium]|nr:topoisomerase DNA-binding C4 zinc finger domain-containing protein [Pseudomonadota bacterium]